MLGKKLISLEPVVELVVVSARIGVLMPREVVRLIENFEVRLNLVINVRLNEWSSKTAIVLRVIHQQSWSGRSHCREMCVVHTQEKVRRNLFDISRVTQPFHFRNERGITCHWHGHGYSFIKRTQRNRLPAPTGKPCHS